MSIPDEDIERVRSSTDIVALISERSALKRQGTRWVGLCPFHQEKTPSFSVNAELGFYYCFGCQCSGDAITFLRETEHIDFADAVRSLADRAGIVITEDATVSADRQKRSPLYEAMERAVGFYHERLLSAPDAGPARDYLRSRGYDGDVVRRFVLGWAPDDWDALATHLRVPSNVLTESGLGFVNRRGRQQDAFRSRIVFPIFDVSGKPIALGGRVLPAPSDTTEQRGHQADIDLAPPDRGPKYKNSPEGPIYSKRRTLYGLNWAKKDIVNSGEVIVCEGYTDVIGVFQVGMPRAVATCGTALAEEHFRLLSNFAKRIVLAYDADPAGQAGAGRVYEWEKRHSVDVAVASLSAGADPADMARSDPDALRAALQGAKPFLAFRVEQMLEGADLKTAEGRVKAAEAALGAVAEHPNGLVRDQYLMMVSDRCRIEPGALREIAERATGQRASAQQATTARSSGTSKGFGAAATLQGAEPPRVPTRISTRARSVESRPGLEALRLAVHNPDKVSEWLVALLFSDPVQRQAFDELENNESLPEAIRAAEAASPDAAQLLHRIAVEEPTSNADDVFIQLMRSSARQALSELEAQARSAPESFEDLASVSAQVRQDIEALESPSGGIAAAKRLLAWLVSWEQETE